MASELNALNAGMADLRITAAAAAGAQGPAAAAAGAAVGVLVDRAVTPYTAPLAAALPHVPKELHALITSYLKPTDTELLLNATFIDFMADTPYRQEALLTVNLWARHLPVMDYSRVFMVFECGLLPLLETDAPGDMAGKVAFRGRAEDGPVAGYIPCDQRVFPDLARIAHARFFSHIRELVNPGGSCFTAGYVRGSARLKTAEELRVHREQQADYPADIDERRVTVQNPVKSFRFEFEVQMIATHENPTYTVTLNLQPTCKKEQSGETVVDHAREPMLRMVRSVGTRWFEQETMVEHVVTHLPPEFAPLQIPNPDPDAAPVANENGFFE